MSDSLKNFWQKNLNLIFSMFYIGFLFKKNDWFTHSLIFGERCERIAQAAHQKWATKSKSLRSLMIKEQPWAIRSFFWANGSFAQKTDEQIPSPALSQCCNRDCPWENLQPCPGHLQRLLWGGLPGSHPLSHCCNRDFPWENLIVGHKYF